MSRRKRSKAKQNLYKQIWQLFSIVTKKLIKWILRSLLVITRQVRRQQYRHSKSGFVLPTIAMVSLVVVLLTTALLFRSFDRSKNASYVRVNEAVLNAAAPAVDRAKAKLDALFNDPKLPRATPSDIALYSTLNSNTYTLGDEIRLKLVQEFNNQTGIQGNTAVLENDETLTTAWKFPVDTDNNEKFDSYTLYGIYFRSPTRGSDGKFDRARNALEARTPPMNAGTLGAQCLSSLGTSGSLVGDSSWYKSGSKLKKSFFIYTATVPITTLPSNTLVGNAQNDYEIYKGSQGFSALELQQDRSRISLTNNAVVFQDDLEITPGEAFHLNGRLFTNANLLVGGHGGAIRLYQVSSKNSCFYEEENSKITVGGNVGTGNVGDTTDKTAVTVDLFQGFGKDPSTATINDSNRSTTSAGGAQVGYNDAAYNRRIALMKQTALSFSTTVPPTVASVSAVSRYPQEVKDGFAFKINAPGGSSLNAQNVLAEEIELYLKNRTRRVPYAEIPAADGTGATSPYNPDTNGINTSVFDSEIEPRAIWREPTNTNTGLTLNTNNLQQTQPEKQRKDGVDAYLGDRVNVGNNLPGYWKNSDGKYVTGSDEKQYLGNGINWTSPSGEPRYRTTQVTPIPDLEISERNGFWEDAAAQQASPTSPNVGGLRVITGAGIYVDDDGSAGTPSYSRSTNSFLPKPTLDSGVSAPPTFGSNPNIVAWFDTMPMTGGSGETTPKGDLLMRATAVYHYKDSSYTDSNYVNRTPTACISSYYDPTKSTTAKNNISIDGGYGFDTTNGKSNNGVVYPVPYTSDSARISAVNTNRTKLNRQARLVFPNGRIVNQPLRNALVNIDANRTRSLADNSAIDTAICALKILDDSSFTPSNAVIPHGAIKEASFLDAREVKAIEGSDTNPRNYDLALEQRQPSEIRVTDIDLGQLAGKTIGGAPQQEYLLPNSGIIYASRDDALPDLSDTSANIDTRKLLSPTDFILDPTRRPNGIRLINGSNLARDNNFREEEKGLILVTNLPAYVKGNFNQHFQAGSSTTTEEFTEKLDSNWGNFYSRNSTVDKDFACRKGQTGCGSNGDQWRPATIISDAISLQSDSYVDGFRNQGDYDLNNNAGSFATNARKKNGFWNNNFVTSATWAGSDSFPSSINSYLTNAVTPIQRRANFPVYVMEICRKLPVSECGFSDWVAGTTELPTATATSLIGTPAANLLSGTTVRPATDAADQRYVRRVAFSRNADGTLKLTRIGSTNATAIPLGVDSSGNVAEYPYPDGGSAVVPVAANNALWFRTTISTDGNPGDATKITYANNQPLYYLAPSQGGAKLILPDTPDIPGVPSLNLPTGDQSASDYAVCIKNGGVSQSYTSNVSSLTTSPGNGNCPTDTYNAISNFIGTGGSNGLDDLTSPNPSGSLTTSGSNITGGTLTAQQILNVYNLPTNNFQNGATITLDAGGNPNAIFVLQAGSSLRFGANCAAANDTCSNGIVVNLVNGANPNNIFWAINGAPQFENVNSANPHRLVGNFVGKSGTPNIGNNTQLTGRILGFVSAPNIVGNATITAITSTDQPSLVPVLQVHTPEGSPEDSLEVKGGLDKWIQQANTDTTFNAAFISGNSPSRPGEDLAGLHNFVRFMQKWSAKVNITGSFIQFKRSAYATGSFTRYRNIANDSGTLSNLGYDLSNPPGDKIPYYGAPTRQWGFDVALLSQSPDLFAQRFTQQPKSPPDEYFRQVGRDDTWVQGLLCAAEASDRLGATGATYTTPAIPNRPSTCPVNLPYPANPAS